MLTTTIAKNILFKSLLACTTRAVYSTSGGDKMRPKEKRKERQLKAYEKLFYSTPLMNINIEMILAINELRPKATYIIATRNGQSPKQISNSTYNIIECLNYIQGFKYFYKSFPALVENMTKVLNDKMSFYTTGLHKVNAVKKLVQMVSNIDSLYGEIFTELVAVYLIWGMESSIKIKRKLIEQLAPLKQRTAEVSDKKKALLQKCSNDQTKLSTQDKQTLAALNSETTFIDDQTKKLIYQNKFLKQEDFLCGLNYCLQHGYYSQLIVKEFMENILQRDNFTLPQFEYFLKDEQEFFQDKPLSNIYNKRALIYCRMYSGAVYRIKILNELKRMRKQDGKFMDFLKQQKQADQAKHSQSSSQQSPFINPLTSGIEQTSQSSSQQKAQYMSDKLIQQSLISKKHYTTLITRYLQLLQRKDVLCYILSEQPTSESLRVLQTEFFSYVNQSNNNNNSNGLLTSADIKGRYINVFKEMFDVERNGTVYVEAAIVEGVFEVILKMYDYSDRKQVWELLKLYQRHLITKDVSQLKSVAPFYVFQKYNYKSNFVASKLFQFINFKYRLGREEFTIKQELILVGTQVCRYLSLYFKLLEPDFANLLTQYDVASSGAMRVSSGKILEHSVERVGQQGGNQLLESKVSVAKYQQEFQQAVEIFLNHYNKMISVIYLQRENSGFLGKGLQLSFQYLRAKYLSTKAYQQNLYVEGRMPEQDIRKIIVDSTQTIKSHREYVKNVYEKQFLTKITVKSPTDGTQTTSTTLGYNPYVQTMFTKKSPIVNPLDQITVILQIVQTAIQLQTMKNVQCYQDVLVVFKSIFQNKKLIKQLSHHQTFPQILKKLIKISQMFKGSYKNQSNKLFQSILNATQFNLNNFLHNARINIAREIINADKTVPIEQGFQPHLQNLELNPKYERNIRIWSQPTYQISKQTVINHIRSDIIHSALSQNSQLQKIIRDQLAKIKTIKPNEKIKNIKFQLNYLEYPYLANVAINKNNELIVVLVRRAGGEGDKPYNAVLNNYYDECESYFRKKGNKVIVTANEFEIRNSLRELIK